jgi:dihydroflavonol-4-reductase
MSSSLVTTNPVLVTGAGGFIAGHVIRVLLEKGYRVRGTVRDAEAETVQRKYPYLLELPGAADRLEFVSADLTDEDCWKAAVDGCEYILHLASPYTMTYDDPQVDLVDPAVNGVLNVFKAAHESGEVKKIVQTSSMAAVSDSFEVGKVYDESDFNETSSLDRNPYYLSKVLAEKAAYKFVEDHSGKEDDGDEKKQEGGDASSCFDLATICPFMVLGTSLSGKTHESASSIFGRSLNGETPGLLDLSWGVTDVRDLALAHVLLMENERALGRF